MESMTCRPCGDLTRGCEPIVLALLSARATARIDLPTAFVRCCAYDRGREEARQRSTTSLG
jgi:hypothetical protein